MLRLLMRTRHFLPDTLWRPLSRLYWNWFWRKEEALEEQQLQKKSQQKIAGSERAVLAEAIAECYPFSSLLEVGCGYGQNFYTIAPHYPHALLIGIDNDETIIQEGQIRLDQANLSRVRLIRADAQDLSEIDDNKFDIVVSCGFLLYIKDTEIETVIGEMLRVCRKRLLLMEQHQQEDSDKAQGLGTVVEGGADGGQYWIRDYRQLLSRFLASEKIRLTKVANPRWKVEQWKDLAHLVEVKLTAE